MTEIPSHSADIVLTALCSPQNRELQIMRIVKHPNVVDLRAFFYSNGDKVSGAIAVGTERDGS